MSDRTMANASMFYLVTVVTKSLIDQGAINRSDIKSHCVEALNALPASADYDEMRQIISIYIETVLEDNKSVEEGLADTHSQQWH